jgi:hypothetical protein
VEDASPVASTLDVIPSHPGGDMIEDMVVVKLGIRTGEQKWRGQGCPEYIIIV